MVVHGSVTKKIQQRDQLVPTGTMVTLGLENTAEACDMGVYWSLPLAHLRFYGDPVQSFRSTGHDASRIPAEHLTYIVLGVIFRNWVKTSSMIHLALGWLSKIYCCIKRAAHVGDGDKAAAEGTERIRKLFENSGWLNVLLSSVHSLNKLHEFEMEVPIKLMATGFRRFDRMLDKDNPLPQVFDLLNARVLFPLLKKDMVEERIRILRRVAAQQKTSPAEMIIRYKRYDSQEFVRIRSDTGGREYHLNTRKEEHYEYASALPCVRRSTKRDHSGKCTRISKHKRWIAMAWATADQYLHNQSSGRSCGCTAPCQCEYFPGSCTRDAIYSENPIENDNDFEWLSLDFWGDADHCDKMHEEGFNSGGSYTGEVPEVGIDKAAVKNPSAPLEEAGYGIRATEILATGEDCVQEEPHSFEQYYSGHRRPSLMELQEENIQREYRRHYKLAWDSEYDACDVCLRDGPWGTGRQSLTFIYGDEDSAALYRVSSIVPLDDVKDEIQIGELESLLDEDALDVGQLINHISRYHRRPYENLGSSLKAFASFIDVYRFLPEATIALKIAYQPLHNASWACHAAAREGAHVPLKNAVTEVTKEQLAPQKDVWSRALNLAETFACIAMFESGTHNLWPAALEHVFAMSSSNSLFIAAPLLNDPSQRYNDNVVFRVVGNIGRAGIAMLIAPQDPRTRKLETDNWELISHAPFDGKIEDSFRNTSLHLSFTHYTMPVDTGVSGGQDIETFFLESLISVYDRDKWVADLDVLKMLGSELFQRHTYMTFCDNRHDQTPNFDLISIDNWEELLDREEVPTVVRAYRNKMARLATAAISVRQGRPTIILPDDFCFACDVSEPRHEATTYIA